MIGRVADRVLGLLLWAKITASEVAQGSLQKLYARIFEGDEFQHAQPYGFQSRPKEGADALVASVGSSASGRVVILVSDRRFTLALEEGEVVMADDLGQKVHLTRQGAVIKAPTIDLTDGATLLPINGVVTGTAIDPFTGLTHFALGNASTKVRAK